MSLGVPDYPIRFDNVRPRTWRDDALCRQADTSLFFDGDPVEAVASWCHWCPVRTPCTQQELEITNLSPSNQEGVRGLTADDRRRLARHMRSEELDAWNLTDELVDRFDTTPRIEVDRAV